MAHAKSASGNDPKLGSLEGLRGMGALIVLFNHLAVAFFPFAVLGSGQVTNPEVERWFHTTPLGLLLAGRFAVNVFFVLSGFVLSRRFVGTNPASHPQLCGNVVKRIFRLAPMVLATVLLTVLLQRTGLLFNVRAAEAAGSLPWLESQAAWRPDAGTTLRMLVLNLFSASPGLINPLWTIKAELQGSFVVYFLLLAFRNSPSRWLGYAGAALWFRNDLMMDFILGLALADLYATKAAFQNWAASPWLAALGLLSAGLLGSFPFNAAMIQSDIGLYHWLPDLQFGGDGWLVLGAVSLIATLLGCPPLRDRLDCRLGRWLGRISFSLYALHLPLILSLGCAVFVWLKPHGGYLFCAAAASGASLIATLLAGELAGRFIDAPAVRGANRIGAWFANGIAERDSVASK